MGVVATVEWWVNSDGEMRVTDDKSPKLYEEGYANLPPPEMIARKMKASGGYHMATFNTMPDGTDEAYLVPVRVVRKGAEDWGWEVSGEPIALDDLKELIEEASELEDE